MTGAGTRDVAGHALLQPVRHESRGLDHQLRTRMEQSFGTSFGDVVVHEGTASGALAEAFDAAAFTVGRHVVFGPGRFDITSLRGRSLIAHELGHVVEQRRGGGDLDVGDRLPAGVIPLHGGHSEAAGRTAAQAALGNTATVAGASGVGVARQTKQDEEQSALAMAPAMNQAMTQPREAPAPAAPVLQLPAGNARTASRTVMKAIEDLTPLPDGRYTTTYLGKTLVMSAEDAEKTRAAARNSLVEVVTRSRRRFDDALGRYQAQEEVDKEFWFSSKAAHAAAWIGTLGDHEDPGMALALQRPVVQLAELSVQRLVADGRLAAAAEEATRAEAASGRSAALVRIYVDETIEGAEDMVSGLEFTRDAAFVTLGVLAVVATAGAAAGLAPGVVGAGVGGMSVGTTATVISVGAPIVANVGVGLVKLAEGDPVDWGDIAVDAAIQVVLARFGGKLGEKVFGKLAGNPLARTAVRRVLASVGSGVVSHEASQVFSVTVNETYAALRGRDVSWGDFVDELTDRLTDPKGIFMAAAMSGFQVVAHGAIDKAAAAKAGSSGGGSSKPPPPPGKPPAAPVKEPVVTTQKPPTPVQKTAVSPVQKPAVTQKPATPQAVTAKAKGSSVKKSASSTSPSALKRKAEAGERMRSRAENRSKAAAATEAQASTKVAAAKTRLAKAQEAVDARKQTGRNPTKKQQDALQRAKKAVAKSETGQVRATKSALGAQARLQGAQKEATARSTALSKAQAAAANKPTSTGDKPRFDQAKHGAFDPKKYRRPDLSKITDTPAPTERVGADGMRKNPDARVTVFEDPLGSRVAPLGKGTKQQQGHDYERQLRDDLLAGDKYRETHAAGDKTRHGDVGAYETKFKGALSSDDLDQIWRDLNNPARGHSAVIITPKANAGDLGKLAKLAAAFEKLTGVRPRIAVRETGTTPGGVAP